MAWEHEKRYRGRAVVGEAQIEKFDNANQTLSALILVEVQSGPNQGQRLRFRGYLNNATNVERTIEEVLLPSIEVLAQDGGQDGPEHGFAWRWSTSWLAASMRVTPAATRDEGVVIFDASGPCDVESLYGQALELALRRRGLRTLTLAVGLDPARSARALHAIEPRAIVLAGKRADLDALGRLVFAARRIGGDSIVIYDFRGALPDSGASTVTRLASKPLAAVDQLVSALDGRELWPSEPTGLDGLEGLDAVADAASLRKLAG